MCSSFLLLCNKLPQTGGPQTTQVYYTIVSVLYTECMVLHMVSIDQESGHSVTRFSAQGLSCLSQTHVRPPMEAHWRMQNAHKRFSAPLQFAKMFRLPQL